MTDERKIREIYGYGMKSVLDEAAERIEARWREKLLRETAALKDRLAASEQRAAVAEAKVEVMTQMKGE